MKPFLDIIYIVLDLVVYVVIAQAIMSWLLSFNVVNLGNRFVATIWQTLNQLTEPVLRPIRNIMPRTGALDLSPIVLILGVIFLQSMIRNYIYPNVI